MYEDLRHKKFGKLKPIEYMKFEDGSRPKWLCQCDCGKQKYARPDMLKNGTIRSCGCEAKENPKPRNDLTGKRFGKLIVLEFSHIENHFSFYRCKCDCGKEKIARGRSLIVGDTKSCGCLKPYNDRMGLSQDRIYKVWWHMIGRCYDKAHKNYKRYGGRGIAVCQEWKEDFNTFRDWAIINGYSDKLTIDRIDFNGNYEPSNCRWATMKEQANNTSWNRIIEHNGRSQTLSQWADEYGIKYALLEERLRKGWDTEKALTRPPQIGKEREQCRFVTYNGETHNVSQWAKILGIKQTTLDARLHNGWPIEKAFTTPVRKVTH